MNDDIKDKYIALLEQRIKELEEKEKKITEKPTTIYVNCPLRGSGGAAPYNPYPCYGGGGDYSGSGGIGGGEVK